ncbi:hypothetical protein SLITK23_24400 [Streptomyces lividans]|nr:hypothetical protein SLITK23_24400 [Streptomyces lividans]
MTDVVVTLPRTLVHGEPDAPKFMVVMSATSPGLPVALAIVPAAVEVVHVMGMVAVSTMLPTFTALKAAGEGLTVHTVEGTAEEGTAARPSADAAAHTTRADLLMFFFMTRTLLEG